jgi:hypothetical protein
VQNLVVGDICIVESGQRVPADIRIIKTDSLKVGLRHSIGTDHWLDRLGARVMMMGARGWMCGRLTRGFC